MLNTFCFCYLKGAAWIHSVYETSCGFAAAFKYFWVFPAYLGHFIQRNGPVMQGSAPIRSALEHGKLFCGLSNFLNSLDTACPGSDDCYPLVVNVDVALGPEAGMAPFTFELLYARKARHSGRR